MNGVSGRHWPSDVRVVSTHVVETGADDDGVVNDMIHDRVVVRPLSRWCVLDEVLCTGHGVGDVVPVLHYLEEKRRYTFAKPAECGSPNTNNVYALYILPSQIGHNFAWCHRSPADDNYAIVATQNVNHTSGHAVNHTPRPISTIR